MAAGVVLAGVEVVAGGCEVVAVWVGVVDAVVEQPASTIALKIINDTKIKSDLFILNSSF